VRTLARSTLLALALVSIQVAGISAAHAAAGDLDDAFGQGGVVLSTHVHLAITAIAVQPDGSIVAAGIGATMLPSGCTTIAVMARWTWVLSTTPPCPKASSRSPAAA